MADDYFLTLDQGGSASRAMVFNARGEMVASARENVTTSRPRHGWVEQNPEEIVDSLRRATATALATLTAGQRADICCCGLVTQRSSLVCWDRLSGKALSPVLSWQDTRGADWLAEQAFDLQDLYLRTGLYPNAHFGASKMHWCLQHNEAVKSAALADRLRIAPLATFLADKLLQESPFLVDPANASRTLLMNLAEGDWDPVLLELFAIKREWLPEIVPSAFNFGAIEMPGLKAPLNLLSGDQSAAAFSNGMPNRLYSYLNLGTGAFIYRRIDRPAMRGRLLNSILHRQSTVSDPIFVVEGTVNGAGAALQWYAQEYAVEEVAQRLESAFLKFDDGTDRSLDGGQGSEGVSRSVVFINGVGGVGSPDWCAQLRPRFVEVEEEVDVDAGGISATDDESLIAAQLLAMADSIVFLIYRNYRVMDELEGQSDGIIISGGLSNSDQLCQNISDLLQLSLWRSDECEASARGAAFLLAGSPQHWQALGQRVFHPKSNTALNKRFECWTLLMDKALGEQQALLRDGQG